MFAILPFMIVFNVSCGLGEERVYNRRKVNNSQCCVIDDNADSDANKTKKRDQEPEKGILRSQKQIVLGEIDSRFSSICPPARRLIIAD